MSRPRAIRARSAGLTLLEVMITLAIVALVSTLALRGFRTVARTELRGQAMKLAGSIRYLFNRASTTGKIHRLVIDFDSGKYWAEVTDDRVYLPRERETEESRARETEKIAEEEKAAKEEAERRASDGDDESEAYDVSRYQVKEFVPSRAKFEGFKDMTLKPIELKTAKIASYYTPRLMEPTSTGKAYLYFFPLGQTEPALLHVSDKEQQVFYSLLVHPLTGHVKIHDGYIEPRVDEQYDDEGNRIEQ